MERNGLGTAVLAPGEYGAKERQLDAFEGAGVVPQPIASLPSGAFSSHI